MTIDRPVYTVIDQWPIIGHLYCMTSFFIGHYNVSFTRVVTVKRYINVWYETTDAYVEFIRNGFSDGLNI